MCSCRLFILITIECSSVELNHDEFIHSATYRHLSSNQFAIVMNSAVINICEHVFEYLVLVLLGIYLGVKCWMIK